MELVRRINSRGIFLTPNQHSCLLTVSDRHRRRDSSAALTAPVINRTKLTLADIFMQQQENTFLCLERKFVKRSYPGAENTLNHLKNISQAKEMSQCAEVAASLMTWAPLQGTQRWKERADFTKLTYTRMHTAWWWCAHAHTHEDEDENKKCKFTAEYAGLESEGWASRISNSRLAWITQWGAG